MKQKNLQEAVSISSLSIAKLNKSDNIATDVLWGIVNTLDCTLEKLLERVKD